jgi:hypothetical protein
MPRSRDPLNVGPQWHVDFRLEAELPEDRIVGRRFLVNAFATVVVFSALLVAGWLAYVNVSLQGQILDWEQRIKDNRSEVREVEKMRRDYTTEAVKIDQAYALVRPRLHVSGFIADIGRTRPELMAIDIIEWNDGGIAIRGNLQERSEAASRILGGYVEQLRHDPNVGPLFREIVLTNVTRGTSGDTLRFEIALRLKPVNK